LFQCLINVKIWLSDVRVLPGSDPPEGFKGAVLERWRQGLACRTVLHWAQSDVMNRLTGIVKRPRVSEFMNSESVIEFKRIWKRLRFIWHGYLTITTPISARKMEGAGSQSRRLRNSPHHLARRTPLAGPLHAKLRNELYSLHRNALLLQVHMSLNPDEEAYLRLLRELGLSHMYLSPHDLKRLALAPQPQNPFHALSPANIESERRFSYCKGFDQLLSRKQIRWEHLRKPIIALAEMASVAEILREEAADKTEPLPELSKIAIAYSGYFQRRFSKSFFPPALECARRAPALFAGRLLKENAPLAAISADEWLTMPPSIFTAIQDIAIFYVCTHGRIQQSQYQAALHDRYWQPSPADFGANGPKVLVLDTCHGADRTPPFRNFWGTALQGTSVRLLLACEGPIVIDTPSTERGYAFADNIVQENTSIADAWLRAVRSTSSTGTSRPVAIGLGDTAAEATTMLSLTFHDLRSAAKRPSPLSPRVPVQFADRH